MTADTILDQLWGEAVDRYMAATNRSPDDKKILLQLHKVDDLVQLINKESTKSTGFRLKREKFLSVLKQSVNSFIVISTMAANDIPFAPFEPASVIFGAVAFLIKAAHGVSESYDWIEQLFDKLREFTQRLEEYFDGGVGGIHAHLHEKVLAILCCLLDILARAETVMKSGLFKKYTAVLFLAQDDKVKASFGKLAKLFDDEQRLVLAISFATNQRIEQKTDDIDKTTKQTLEATEEVQKTLDDVVISVRSSENKALLDDSLLTPAYQKNITVYNEYAEYTIEHTGDWLLKDENVKRWMHGELPLLWVFGGPGTGKSCLSSTLITTLVDKYPQDPKHPNRKSVAYFYFKEYDDDLRGLLPILKSLAYQIAKKDTIFKNFATGILSKPDSVATPRLLWKNLFLGFYAQDRKLSNSALIVIDGLDEAPRQIIKDFFFLLEDLTDISKFGNRFSWALFGRPELSEFLEPKFNRIVSKVEIGNKNESDIAQYIKQRLTGVLVVKQTRQLKNKTAAARLARDIREKVLGKADGMFFKVVLIMDAIHDKERNNTVFEAIEEAPPKLDEMIAHVFDKLMLNEDVNKDDLNEILLWVAFGKQELSVGQLYSILKRRTGHAYDALEGRLRGRFASIFKLRGGNVTSNEQMARPNTLQNSSTSQSKVLNEDDDEFDIDSILDDEDEDISATQTTADSTTEDQPMMQGADGLSKETVERFSATFVRFTHASIRDFLTQPRSYKLDSHTGSIPIRVDTRLADLHIANMCMQRIVEYGTDYSDLTFKPDFINYSGWKWSDHLTSAGAVDLTDAEKASTLKTLVILFFDSTALVGLIRGMIQAAHVANLLYLFGDPTTVTTIRTAWLPAAKKQDFTSEQWEWIQRALVSSKSFLEPLGHAAAKLWLTKSGPGDIDFESSLSDTYYCWIAWAWLRLDESQTETQALNLSPFFSYDYPTWERAIFDKIPETFDIEKTQYYYAALGWCLMKASYYDEDQTDRCNRAKEIFQKSLEMDPNYWFAIQGLASIACKEEDYTQASVLYDKALKHCPKSLKQPQGLLRGYVGCVLLDSGDYEAAAKRAAEDYVPNPEVLDGGQCAVTCLYIMSLFPLGKYDRIHEIMVDISHQPKVNALIAFFGLHVVHKEIGISLWKHGDVVDIIQPLMDIFFHSDPTEAFIKQLPWVAVVCARFMMNFYPTADTAIETLERLAAPKFSADLSEGYRSKFEESRADIEQWLAELYADKAREAHKGGKDPKEWSDKLRALAVAEEAKNGGPPTYTISPASLLLGAYLRESGAAENHWRACIQPTMMQGIDLLCDDDIYNDHQAYCTLSDALLAAGDVPNAIATAASRTMGQLHPDVMDKLSELGFGGSRPYTCDGPCMTENFQAKTKDGESKDTWYREVWSCTQCYNTQFCEECIEIAKAGELPTRICRNEHTFIKLHPTPEDLRTRAAIWNPEKERVEVNKEWLEELRKEWS